MANKIITSILIGLAGIFIIVVVLCFLFFKALHEAKVTSNDALAKATLRALSTAAESYGVNHQGKYPLSVEDLTNSNPPYLGQNYCNQTIAGFHYDCEFGSDTYRFKAIPESTDTGTEEFMIMTGGILE